MKRIFAVLFALTLMFSALAVMPIKAYAAEVPFEKSKIATDINNNGRFEVETQVSYTNKDNKHNEVIVMVDGSYSTDDDWSTTRSAILKIGDKIFDGSDCNTLLTIMTFGMGDNVVIEHIESKKQLDKSLTKQPGGLLYGRSFTNCEAGFTGISEYIKKHDNTLNKVHVIYITDGNVNTDETKYVFDKWTENVWLKKDSETLAKWSIDAEVSTYEKGKTKLSNAYITVFDESNKNSIKMTDDEKVIAWADKVWTDVYEYSGMKLGTAYTISDTERAFIKYDKEKGTHVREIFYYSTWGRDYPNGSSRAFEAGRTLAENEKVQHIYMVDMDKSTSWMKNMESTVENISFYEAGSISNLLKTLDKVLDELEYTSYSEVMVTDYMSKWVKLDITTIKVVDNNSRKTIWTSENGWNISKDRPVSQENPVVVEMVSSNKYKDGGYNVVGNENDIIYKITWYVKDGGTFKNYNYSLVYEIDVDVHENDFRYNTKYPSNGYTTINYFSKNGNEVTNITKEIEIPEVIVNKEEPETTEPATSEPEVETESTIAATETTIADSTVPDYTAPNDSSSNVGDYIFVAVCITIIAGVLLFIFFIKKNKKF